MKVIAVNNYLHHRSYEYELKNYLSQVYLRILSPGIFRQGVLCVQFNNYSGFLWKSPSLKFGILFFLILAQIAGYDVTSYVRLSTDVWS